MNNVKRAIGRAVNHDWQYDWKLTLSADVVRFVDLPCPHIWENKFMRVEPDPAPECQNLRTKITMRAGYSWDGCSVVPDAPGTHDASCVHDGGYQFCAAIASAWNMSQAAELQWFNKAFLQIMRQDKCPVAGLYYTGVYLFGRPFHWLAGIFSQEGT